LHLQARTQRAPTLPRQAAPLQRPATPSKLQSAATTHVLPRLRPLPSSRSTTSTTVTTVLPTEHARRTLAPHQRRLQNSPRTRTTGLSSGAVRVRPAARVPAASKTRRLASVDVRTRLENSLQAPVAAFERRVYREYRTAGPDHSMYLIPIKKTSIFCPMLRDIAILSTCCPAARSMNLTPILLLKMCAGNVAFNFVTLQHLGHAFSCFTN
jgi:hypothetical protein